jgi:cysteinyl-tRNA synthetase
MITKHLGYKVDISCGGVDNLYRHHDYNIAIIEGLSGETYARCWLHGEHVLLDGKKMSKSKGNVVYPEDLIQRGYTPRQIRFFLCRKHYREKLDMNDKSLDDACSKLSSLRRTARSVCRSDPAVKDSASGIEAAIEAMARGFEERMSDDLDVEGAVSHLQSSLDSLEKAKSAGSLGHRDANRIRQVLTDVDSVLAVIEL